MHAETHGHSNTASECEEHEKDVDGAADHFLAEGWEERCACDGKDPEEDDDAEEYKVVDDGGGVTIVLRDGGGGEGEN